MCSLDLLHIINPVAMLTLTIYHALKGSQNICYETITVNMSLNWAKISYITFNIELSMNIEWGHLQIDFRLSLYPS